MNCPKCEKTELKVLHTDSVECTDCGSTMNTEYCLCPNCQYACRMINGKFLDAMEMTTDALNEVVEDLEGLLDECDDPKITWAADSHIGSMLDLVHPGVKCGETMTAYNQDTLEYECLGCGFKWEVLNCT